MKKERYYQCPKCGSIITYSKMLEECSSGGTGMCYCEFNQGKILTPYKRISKKKYQKANFSRNKNK